MSFKVSFRKRPFRLIIAIAVAVCFSPSLALAGSHINTFNNNTDGTITSNFDANIGQKFGGDNLTFEVNSGITYNRQGHNTLDTDKKANLTIIVNSGSTLSAHKPPPNLRNRAIKADESQDLTITNSGFIWADDSIAIRVQKSDRLQITNNSGGEIYASKVAISDEALATTNPTITNSGKIYITGTENAVKLTGSSGATVTNNAGGEIYNI